jgi:FlaA1/EpsC-like NDP-sugar epimerase
VIASLEGIDWRSFLARPALPAPSAESLDGIRDARILITGAGGSIGSALALRIAALGPRSLVLLESSENQLFALQGSLRGGAPRIAPDYVLGSVLDSGLLEEIFDRHRPSLIFHTAAYKHVPLLEGQPLAAIENNVFGTAALAQAAAAHRARVILLSTDKAVEPASVMGATKRVAERIVLGLGGTAVRLGNVLGTSGSVAEVFAAQIGAGAPVTVTDPAAKRYFLTLGEAVNILLSAATVGRQFPLLAPDLRNQHFVADLAHFMAQVLTPGQDNSVVFTAPRCGDKESEKLWGKDERVAECGVPGLLSIDARREDDSEFGHTLASLRSAVDVRDVPTAIVALQSLVPEFTPSSTVISLMERDSSRATL